MKHYLNSRDTYRYIGEIFLRLATYTAASFVKDGIIYNNYNPFPTWTERICNAYPTRYNVKYLNIKACASKQAIWLNTQTGNIIFLNNIQNFSTALCLF